MQGMWIVEEGSAGGHISRPAQCRARVGSEGDSLSTVVKLGLYRFAYRSEGHHTFGMATAGVVENLRTHIHTSVVDRE